MGATGFSNKGKSISSSLSHSASLVVVSSGTSSASAVDLVKTVCLQDLHATAAPARVNTNPLVALILSASEIQLESLYPSNTGGYPV